MEILLKNIAFDIKHKKIDIEKKIKNTLKISNFKYRILKKSIDSRKKNNIKIVYSFAVKVDKKIKGYDLYEEKKYNIEKKDFNNRPIIVGFGPAGMFCALVLAYRGARPIIIERGSKVEKRISDIELFFKEKKLNINSNIQFGEGGAGTFSDGKLSTGIKDRYGRRNFILDEFINAGANKSIKYLAKPHVGTDYLVKVVKNIRKKIISLGGDIYFDKKVTDIKVNNDKICGVYCGNELFKSDTVIFATGHSSRDTFYMLEKRKIKMEAKDFAVGLRIEHLQEDINKSQYGTNKLNEHLLTSEYKLTYKTKEGRSVYSFCMCPGGYIVNAASEEEMLCSNGMSNYKRNTKNANSAIVVGINKNDYKKIYGDTVLSGVMFQRDLERKAFILGGSDYSMPTQLLGDYKRGVVSNKFGKVNPVNKSNYIFANLNDIFPNFINKSIKEAISYFGNKISGFDDDNAILTAVESRTSSPIRIYRNEDFSSNYKGLYFCGEGAGYAGGIMSAAIDGMKIAESI